MSRIADATRASRLRALRFTRPVAGASLCRVLGTAARVRRRLASAIVYDARARALVRAWKERGRRGSRVRPRSSSRGRRAAGGGRVPRTRARRSRARVAARRRPCACARERARADAGRSRSSTSSSESRTSLASADSRSTSVAGTCAEASARAPRFPPSVCVVDDVYTSGATVDACASACRRAGATPRRGDHARAGRPLD